MKGMSELQKYVDETHERLKQDGKLEEHYCDMCGRADSAPPSYIQALWQRYKGEITIVPRYERSEILGALGALKKEGCEFMETSYPCSCGKAYWDKAGISHRMYYQDFFQVNNPKWRVNGNQFIFKDNRRTYTYYFQVMMYSIRGMDEKD